VNEFKSAELCKQESEIGQNIIPSLFYTSPMKTSFPAAPCAMLNKARSALDWRSALAIPLKKQKPTFPHNNMISQRYFLLSAVVHFIHNSVDIIYTMRKTTRL